MVRQDAGGERANLVMREVELARAAEHARRVRESASRGADRRPSRLRTAAASTLRAAVLALDPAALREPRLGRDRGC
jgi:hypothetical protein